MPEEEEQISCIRLQFWLRFSLKSVVSHGGRGIETTRLHPSHPHRRLRNTSGRLQ